MDSETALSEVDAATARAAVQDMSSVQTLKELQETVRMAHQVWGIPYAELARRTGRHRNTIATWCSE